MKSSLLVSFLLMVGAMIYYSPAIAADGCYVSGVLYDAHTPKSGAYFYRAPNIIASCGIIGTLSGSCRLYDSGDINKNSSYTRYNGAYSSSISAVTCPIDTKLWLCIIPLMGFTVFRLRLNFKS